MQRRSADEEREDLARVRKVVFLLWELPRPLSIVCLRALTSSAIPVHTGVAEELRERAARALCALLNEQ